MKRRIPVVTLLLGALLMIALLVSLRSENIAAAPMAAPTPVTVTYSAGPSGVLDFLRVPVSYTADFNTSALTIQEFPAADFQYTIDQTAVSSVVNTTTLILQFSNDNTNWTTGPTIASAITADGSVMQQYALFGRYARINVDVANTNPITISVVAVAK